MLLQAACDAIDVLVATRSSPWPDQACRSPGQRATHRLASANLPQFSGIGIKVPAQPEIPYARPNRPDRPDRAPPRRCRLRSIPRHPVLPAAHPLDQRAAGARAPTASARPSGCASNSPASASAPPSCPRRATRWLSATTTGPAGYTGPHVLFYGHYDVQPVDPLELWHSPPFEPQLVDGPHGKRFVARGAVDDKGQSMMFLEALRAWHHGRRRHPCPPDRGDRGRGRSRQRQPRTLPARSTRTCCAPTLALISDTGMWDIDTPAVTTRLRGMSYIEVTLQAANRDLHSGLFGGSALNPINALTRILGDLHGRRRTHPVPGLL